MKPEQWLEVKEAFERVRVLDANVRERAIAAIPDPRVRLEVRELVGALDSAPEFLEQPAILAGAGVAAHLPSGQRLGNHTLVRQIAEGGMGVVYEGRRADGEFEQRVAVKLIRRWLTGDGAVERFRAERQILARLDHPSIARLIDGGTTADGLPFLIMEFVDGIRIDAYCERHVLDTRARLQLFREVCEAVEYAHGQGIVHRDLKPANILVSSAGRPKLLDFGIAKVVDPEDGETATLTLSRQATPHYASPEQLRGEPTTPTSDIYSLGVLLYELLTGRSPYADREGTVQTIARAVYEAQSPAPSKITGNREWRRSLDRIVATAMQKNPALRYTGVRALIGDIDRYLNGRSVSARPAPFLPRWGRRRAVWVGLGMSLLLAGLWLWREGPAVLKLRSPFAQLYAEGLERQQHFDWPAARSLFRRAVDAEPSNAMGHYAYSAALQALGYESLARREAKLAADLSAGVNPENKLLIRGRYQEYTGDRAGAVETYRKLAALSPGNTDYALRLAESQAGAGSPAEALRTLGSIRGISPGSAAAARVLLQRARANEMLSDYPQELADAQAAAKVAARAGVRLLDAEALEAQGDALREMNRFDEAVKIYADAEALSREDGDLYSVASIENRLGGMYLNKGDYQALEAHSNTALALFRQIDNKTAQASILNNLSVAMKTRGDLTGAVQTIAQAVEISRQAGNLHALSGELTNMGLTLRRLGREAEARKAFEESLDCAQRLGERDQVARSHITLEILERDNGNLAPALDHVKAALNLLSASKAMNLKSLTLQHLGDDLHASGDTVGGKAALEESLAMARPANSGQLTADDAFMLAGVAREQRDFRRAAAWLRQAEPYYIAQNEKENLWDAWVEEARLRMAEGRPGGTQAKLREAAEGFRKVKDEARECRAQAALIESYLAQGKSADALLALADSRAVCAATHEYEARMIYSMAALRVKAETGDSRAGNDLKALARDLKKNGWDELAREAGGK